MWGRVEGVEGTGCGRRGEEMSRGEGKRGEPGEVAPSPDRSRSYFFFMTRRYGPPAPNMAGEKSDNFLTEAVEAMVMKIRYKTIVLTGFTGEFRTCNSTCGGR
ncbi:hypothetical protein GCM10017673_41580 [Streptosporangium violaceochromogenes]|nr:hypothetical protein GCM10017673_41580 [Streptosporangium violaceochromogenes]